jgi:hypothetical protein
MFSFTVSVAFFMFLVGSRRALWILSQRTCRQTLFRSLGTLFAREFYQQNQALAHARTHRIFQKGTLFQPFLSSEQIFFPGSRANNIQQGQGV